MGKQLKKYAAFLSYKSEDVFFVRAVAERLLSFGLRVWFAEYHILLKNYDLFKAEIDTALTCSEFLVCFTNDAYIASQYCRYEIETFIKFSSHKDRVIEIQYPPEHQPHTTYPWLAQCSSIISPSIDEAISFLVSRIGTDLPLSLLGKEKDIEIRRVFDDGRERYSLNVKDWDIDLRQLLPANGGDIEGPKFERLVDGDRIWGNLFIGDQVAHPRAWRTPTGDDRQYYRYAMDFAKHFYLKRFWWRLFEQPVGLHLLFLAGYSHMAITSKTIFGMWTRRYSVVLPSPRGRSGVEFAFIFFFRGTFEVFARNAHLVDAIVSSLELQR